MKPVAATGATERVWDLPVRLLHWTLFAAVLLAGLSTLSLLPDIGIVIGAWHQPAGYVTLLVVLLRIVWGFVGGRHARWSDFLRSPRATWRYLQQVQRGKASRHLGHNPLGAWMVLLLMACIGGLGLTGWLYTTDRYWGSETVETIHDALAWLLLALVVTHVAGVIFTGRRQRENLVRSMISGRKPISTEAEVDR